MSVRVVVAMSGGVDSSVAAALLAKRGYDVVGLAMRLADYETSATAGRKATCCSYDDFEDARRVAERMGFPFYVTDMREAFRSRVIDDFVGEYLNGRTPNPCMRCNREIKFDALWRKAAALGASVVATGHYARIARDDSGRYHLMRARDECKDQSYFLFTLGQAELGRTVFPLGEMTKQQVRAIAREMGLVNADKPESQEICFVPDRHYARFVEQAAGSGRIRAGKLVDDQGNVLGSHGGVHRFTIGQRRGLGLSADAPLYVRRIDPQSARVTVGTRAELSSRGLRASNVRLVDPRLREQPAAHVEIKIRYRHPAVGATVQWLEGGQAEVRFDADYPAVTPGQACVFYRREEVLGGGIIEQALES